MPDEPGRGLQGPEQVQEVGGPGNLGQGPQMPWVSGLGHQMPFIHVLHLRRLTGGELGVNTGNPTPDSHPHGAGLGGRPEPTDDEEQEGHVAKGAALGLQPREQGARGARGQRR